jgi:hypothetical protein
VAPQLLVERTRGVARGLERPGVGGAEDAAEELVEPAVLAAKEIGERRIGHGCILSGMGASRGREESPQWRHAPIRD